MSGEVTTGAIGKTGVTGKRGAGIAGTGSAVPEGILSNFDLEKMVDTSDAWIVERTGIRERRIAGASEATSDLAALAASRALEDAGVSPGDVDLIIVATVTPDMIFPSTACLVQARIGATRAAAFDISAGCSGFIYGVWTGAQFIASGTYDTVLVIGAETLSKITDFTNRNTCVLFGDGAGACVLKAMEQGEGIVKTLLGADGRRGDLLTVPAGGSRLPASHETVDQRLHYIHMEGNKVYRFAVNILVDACRWTLEAAGLSESDIDYFIPHQANRRLIDIAAERLGVADRFYSNVEKYGNTSAASIPIALDEAARSGKISDGDLIMLVGFGAGLTWAASIIRWCKGYFRAQSRGCPEPARGD
ncbi:MAG: ketoacyl-ACP synthase III [Firmicutes bacterium]|nr:ketoacyl-ACP synthase III [Bacillota bacterium]